MLGRLPGGSIIMGFGIVELISLLLSLAGFGITANPKAPTVDQALEYAMPDADFVVHFDAGAVIPTNYKILSGLADQPQIKSSPELSKLVRQVVNEVEGARGMVKSATGVDLTTDVNDATMFVQLTGRDPKILVVAHGKFTSATLDKVAGMVGRSTTKVGTGTFLELDHNSAAGVTKSNAVIISSPQMVKDRLDSAWKSPTRPAGSNLAYAAEVIGGKPVYAVISTMSPSARKEAIDKLDARGANFATDLIGRHKLAAFSLYANGIGWEWIDSKAGGVDQIATMSEGLVDVFRAAQIAPRAIAKIAMAGLESYRGVDNKIDEVLAQKASLLKIVDQFTGDGKFTSKIEKNAGAMKVNVRLTGKSISEVVPFSMVLPGLAAAMLFERGKEAAPAPPPAVVRPPPPQPKPRGTGLTK
jgi:hypothetical protein